MKSVILLAVLLALSVAGQAGHVTSSVVIRSQAGPVLVSLDRHPASQVTAVHRFADLYPGRHLVEIFEVVRPAHPYGPGQHRLVYSGYIDARAGFRTVYVWNRSGLRLNDSRPLPPVAGVGCAMHGGPACTCPVHAPWGYPYGQGNPGHQPGCGNGCCPAAQPPSGYTPFGYGYPGNHPPGGYPPVYGPAQPWPPQPWPHNPGGQPWYGGRVPMTDQQFQGFMQRLRSPFSDAQKLDVLKREIDREWLTNQQVEQVLSELTFESSRLEAAQYLYHRSAEPDSYHGVASAFTFSSSRDSLNEYMERHPYE